MIKLLSFDSDKIEVAVMLYPNVGDKENWYQVYSLFSFSSSGNEIEKRISGMSHEWLSSIFVDMRYLYKIVAGKKMRPTAVHFLSGFFFDEIFQY